MPAPCVAIVDIGSNTIKLLVAAAAAPGGLATLAFRTIDARISAGLSQAHPRLGEEGMARGVSAICELLTEAARHQPAHIALVATSAVRDASNGAEFCARVQAATGHTVRILSGEAEANAIGRGLTCDPALGALQDFYVFDLGGGSLECLAFRARRVVQALSLPLGCVRLTERFVGDASQPVSAAASAQVMVHTRQQLGDSGFRFALPPPADAVFAGGSMTTIRAILAAASGVELSACPARVELSAIRQLHARVAALPLAERARQISGLPPARADVFPVALATMIAVAESAGVTAFQHTFYNLRYGFAADLLANAPRPG